MIKPGTLCWLLSHPTVAADWVGRVVEVVEGPGRYPVWPIGVEDGYVVTAPWFPLEAYLQDVGKVRLAPRAALKPFSDPDSPQTNYEEPKAPMVPTAFETHYTRDVPVTPGT